VPRSRNTHHTGQSYSDPTLTGPVHLSSSKEANRALDVVLTNRTSGRTQNYGCLLLVSGTDGTLNIHCHEWKRVSILGIPAAGIPVERVSTHPQDR
jgi:hypothetical protein